MNAFVKVSSFAFFSVLIVAGCATTSTKSAPEQKKSESEPAKAPSIAVRINCINQEFTDESNVAKHEKTFVVVPYKKLKTPGKERQEKDVDETDDLYFARVAKMAEKVLTDAGLTKAKAPGKDTLIVGLSWNTKKRVLGWRESDSFAKNADGRYDVEKLQKGQVYLSELFLKAVGPDKKTTRWQITAESANTDTFYLNVLPPLFIASASAIGKNCEAPQATSIPSDSAEIKTLRSSL